MAKKRERPTVGQIVTKHLQEMPETYDIREMQRAMEPSVCSNLQECIQKNKKIWDHFYIVYLLRFENLLPGALRGYFVARQTRPTPDWDMSLWEYNAKEDQLLYHWTLPDRICGQMMLANPATVPLKGLELLGFVQKFAQGALV